MLNKKAKIVKMPMQPGDVDRTFADIRKAKEVLGYNPKTSFEEGLEKFINWFNLRKDLGDI
jgi:UDP-glucuronate 4-epimerase